MIIKKETYMNSSDGVNQIHVMEWIPEKTVRAVLQISHGMKEYIERYDKFATYMADQGIYVIGNDHLGHGKTAKDEESLGYFADKDGSTKVVADLHRVTVEAKKKYPGIPYILLGHSMGSFMARRYAMEYGNELNALIVMGTGYQSTPQVAVQKGLLKVIGAIKGKQYKSTFVDRIAMDGYNKKFSDARTPVDWLSRKHTVVDQYMKDQHCMFTFTVNGFDTICSTFFFINNKKNISNIPKMLPVLFVSGDHDPVGGFKKGVQKVAKQFKQNGVQNIEVKFYKEARHEILNELEAEKTFEDLHEWIEKMMK